MFNLRGSILKNPEKFRQFSCGENLVTLYNCPLERKFEDIWSHQNYIVYVVEGRKIWHTAHGSYDLRPGSCVFIRTGASIVEQFLDANFCLVVFFVPDDFICDVLKTKTTPIQKQDKKFDPVIPVHNSPTVQAFFNSMLTYFEEGRQPDASLLELKFRELILAIADNPNNAALHAYFCSLLQEPQTASLKKIMEDNYCFNLKLEEFALMTNRSLSAFKRDFQKTYDNTPGKWLLEKRLQHAMHLLTHLGKTVSEASFESGFENPSHFSRAFRRNFGITPVAVKQQISN